MKKLLLTLAGMLCLAGSASAATYTITAADVDWGTATNNVLTKTVDGFTFTAKKNNGSTDPQYVANGSDFRVYAKGTLEISCSEKITSIVFNISTAGKKRLAPITVDEGEIATQTSGDETVSWTGSASSITFTVGEKANYGSDGSSKAGQLCWDYVTITTDGAELAESGIAWSAESYIAELGDEYVFPTLTNPNNLAVTYASSNEEVATITETGVIEVLGVGTTQISASFKGNEEYMAAIVKYALIINEKEEEGTTTITAETLYADGYSNTKTHGGYTFVAANPSGTAPTYNTNYNDMRLYAGNTLTITAESENVEMTSITFNLSAQGLNRLAPITANEGTIATQAKGDETVVWTGNANSVTFTVGEKADYGKDGSSKAGQLDWSSVKIIAQEAAAQTVAKPVITSAEGEEGVVVTITCDTEGAAIYYTLDETEPTAESTPYTERFTIYDTVTVKAIAIVGEESSRVATETIKVIPSVPTLNAFEEEMNGAEFRFTTDLTVVYVNGSYNYVIDADKNYGLIYKKDLNLNAGDVIKGGWLGKVKVYNGLIELVPQEDLTVEGTASIPTPTPIKGELGLGMMNQYVQRFGVVFTPAAEQTRAAAATGEFKLGEYTINVYDQFNVAQPTEAGTYNIIGFVSVFAKDGTTTVQLLPTVYNEVTEVAAPTFSQPGGKYEDTIEITLACETEEAVIYYSVDGSEPTTEYVAGQEISINQAYVTVKAVAKLGNVTSDTATANYEILSLGVDFVAADNDAEYYTVSGVKVNNAAVAPGLYIRVNNGKAQKVIIRK